MNHEPAQPGLVEVTFTLNADDQAYTGAKTEVLWAERLPDGRCRLRNTPFFASGVACMDIVDVEERAGDLHFTGLHRASGHSTFRIDFLEPVRRDQVLKDLSRLGCSYEYSESHSIYAIDVPLTADLQAVMHFLRVGQEHDWWDVDHACLGH